MGYDLKIGKRYKFVSSVFNNKTVTTGTVIELTPSMVKVKSDFGEIAQLLLGNILIINELD